jgi:thioredoxin-dependent peroxiredoxin
MATITLGGNPINTSGKIPEVGSKAPDFKLTNTELGDVSLKDYSGKKVVLNVFPSIDTPICATSTRHFNKDVTSLENTVVLCISMDLPFAHKRFCAAEGIDKAITLSELHDRGFGESYGLRIIDGPLKGLLSRAVIVLDANHHVVYTEQVPEIKQEPDYEKALSALK